MSPANRRGFRSNATNLTQPASFVKCVKPLHKTGCKRLHSLRPPSVQEIALSARVISTHERVQFLASLFHRYVYVASTTARAFLPRGMHFVTALHALEHYASRVASRIATTSQPNAA